MAEMFHVLRWFIQGRSLMISGDQMVMPIVPDLTEKQRKSTGQVFGSSQK